MLVKVGEIVGKVISKYDKECVVIGSTDLTHYGYNYEQIDKGTGMAALDWVKNVNDKKLVDLILSLDSEKVVPRASSDRSACGSGAISSTISAVKGNGS